MSPLLAGLLHVLTHAGVAAALSDRSEKASAEVFDSVLRLLDREVGLSLPLQLCFFSCRKPSVLPYLRL